MTGQELVLIGVIAVIWVGLALATPAFLTAGSIRPLLVATAPIALIGVGMTIIIITGGIDVSVGGAIMVCSVITAKALVADMSLSPAVLLSVAVGGAARPGQRRADRLRAGARDHHHVRHRQHLPVPRPADLRLEHGQRHPADLRLLRPRRGRADPRDPARLPDHRDASAAIAWWYLRHTAGGRHFYAIGGDAHAARLAGVKVQRRVLLAYLVTGLLVGLASCFVIAQGTSTLDQSVGTGKELAVIAAVVIGGTSIMGGRGSVLGTFLGALLVQTVTSGVTQLGWKSQLSDLFVGIFIIIAVGTDLLRERARRTA